MNERISQLLLLAAYSNGVGERMKSSEPLPSELPERLCAEQAAKTPLQPLTGSCDSAKRDSRNLQDFGACAEPAQSLRRDCAEPAQGLGNLRLRPERLQTDWAASTLCSDSVDTQIKKN